MLPLVLVVEDDRALAAMMRDILVDEGYRVELAWNGLVALQQLPTLRPNLIITDIAMPHLNGMDFCAAVQSNPATTGIPIILCSAGAEPEPHTPCHYAAFLPKPFDLNRFIQLVEIHMRPDSVDYDRKTRHPESMESPVVILEADKG